MFTLTERESDVYRRQILTIKVYPRAVRVNVDYSSVYMHCTRRQIITTSLLNPPNVCHRIYTTVIITEEKHSDILFNSLEH